MRPRFFFACCDLSPLTSDRFGCTLTIVEQPTKETQVNTETPQGGWALPPMPIDTNPTASDFAASPEVDQLFAALAAAQAEITFAVKDAVNPHLKNRYADLASVWDAVRSALTKHGIAVVQPTRMTKDGDIRVLTILGHKSGQWISSELILPPQKRDAQGIGSAITYARRYQLASMAGVAQDDDDGNEAAGVRGPSANANRQPPVSRPHDPAKKPLTKAAIAACNDKDQLREWHRIATPPLKKEIEARAAEIDKQDAEEQAA